MNLHRMIAMTISSSALGATYAAVSYGAGYVIEDFGFLLSGLLVVLTSILSLPIAIWWLEKTVQAQGFVWIAPWKAVSKVRTRKSLGKIFRWKHCERTRVDARLGGRDEG